MNHKLLPEDTNETTGVHLDNKFNSTPFSDCCGVAVINEKRCICNRIVVPEAPSRRFQAAFRKG